MTTFDAAVWLQKADAVGLGVWFLYSWRGKTGEDWRPMNNLELSDPVECDDYSVVLDLYRELRADKATRAVNEPLLIDYLKRTGRVKRWPIPGHLPGTHEMRSGAS